MRKGFQLPLSDWYKKKQVKVMSAIFYSISVWEEINLFNVFHAFVQFSFSFASYLTPSTVSSFHIEIRSFSTNKLESSASDFAFVCARQQTLIKSSVKPVFKNHYFMCFIYFSCVSPQKSSSYTFVFVLWKKSHSFDIFFIFLFCFKRNKKKSSDRKIFWCLFNTR